MGCSEDEVPGEGREAARHKTETYCDIFNKKLLQWSIKNKQKTPKKIEM